jgi:hypothetical protein
MIMKTNTNGPRPKKSTTLGTIMTKAKDLGREPARSPRIRIDG